MREVYEEYATISEDAPYMNIISMKHLIRSVGIGISKDEFCVLRYLYDKYSFICNELSYSGDSVNCVPHFNPHLWACTMVAETRTRR